MRFPESGRCTTQTCLVHHSGLAPQRAQIPLPEAITQQQKGLPLFVVLSLSFSFYALNIASKEEPSLPYVYLNGRVKSNGSYFIVFPTFSYLVFPDYGILNAKLCMIFNCNECGVDGQRHATILFMLSHR